MKTHTQFLLNMIAVVLTWTPFNIEAQVFKYSNEKQEFNYFINNRKVLAWFDCNTSEERINSIVYGNNLEIQNPSANNSESCFRIIEFNLDYSKETVDEYINYLNGFNEVIIANPTLLYLNEGFFGLTNKLYVKLKKGTDQSVLRVNDLKTILKIEKSPITSDLYCIYINKLNTDQISVLIAELKSLDNVIYVEPNLFFQVDFSTDDTYYDQQWNLENTGSAEQGNGTPGADMDILCAWEYSNGYNVKVAVLDNGVELDHPDLNENITDGFDVVYFYGGTPTNTYGGPKAGSDDAHGTACAGIIAAEYDNGIGTAGISYNSEIVPIRIAHSYGADSWYSSIDWMAYGITWAWEDGNADILSNSWSFVEPGLEFEIINDAIDDAINYGRSDKGAVVFFSSSNSDDDEVRYPASYENSIAVGASSMCDERKSPSSCDEESWGSNYGDALDIVAPGVLIPTTDLTGSDGYESGSYREDFNGTSAACPNAAAVAALIISFDPSLDYDEVRYYLELSAERTGDYFYDEDLAGHPNGTWNEEMGYGRLNACHALQLLSDGTPNDNPCDAINLSVGADCNFILGNNIESSDSGIPLATCDGMSHGDIWFKVAVPASGNLNIETKAGSILDLGMQVLTGSCASMAAFDCDNNSSPYSADMPALYLEGLTPGQTIWIRLWEYNDNDFGTFYICTWDPAIAPCDDPNLVVSNVTGVPLSATAGESLDISFEIENIGGVDGGEDTQYEVNLATSCNTNDVIEDLESDFIIAIDAGESTSFDDITILIPDDVDEGYYTFLISADDNEDELECNEYDNLFCQTIYINGVNTVDLKPVIESVSDDLVSPGDDVYLTGYITNIGTVTSETTHTELYYSYNNTFEPGFDDMAVNMVTDPINSGEVDYENNYVDIPDTATAGIRYLLMVADAEGEQGESDETNNVDFIVITVEGEPGPDFTSNMVSIYPEPFVPGSTLEATCEISNEGDANVVIYTDLNFYLSDDCFKSFDDTYLGTFGISPMAAGITYTPSGLVGIIPPDTDPGTYYIISSADDNNDVPDELNELNNTDCFSIEILEPSAVDAGVTNIIDPISNCDLTSSEEMTLQITNFGTETLTVIPLTIEIGFSTYSETIFTSIDPGETISYTSGYIFDFSPVDDYIINAYTWILGDENPANDEFSFILNSYEVPFIEFGPAITICDEFILDAGNPGSVYLWNTGAETQTITVTETANYSVTVSTPGGECNDYDNVFVTIINSPEAAFTYTEMGLTVAFLSTSLYATSYLWNFGDGFTSTLTDPVHIYSDPGEYSVSLTVTNVCGSDIYNTLISVETPLPDISGEIVSVSPSIAHPGDLISITYSMANLTEYDVEGDFINRFKLSLDCVLLDDFLFRVENFSAVPEAGDELTFTITDTIPVGIPFDTYNLIIALDASEDIDEITDDNNNPCYVSIIVEDTCNIYLSSPGITFNNLGGSGSFNIDTYNGCNWNIESVPSWVTILTPYFGDGPSTVVYNVMENLTCDDRIGDIFVNGELFEITQTGIEESYTLSDYDVSFSSIGGDGSVFVSATTEFCEWDIINPAEDWVTIILGPYSGSNTVYYSVASNIGGGPRSTTLTVAGQPFNIEQDEGLIVENATDIHFNIYPNPANNELIIEIPDQLQNLTVDIINIIGQLVQSHEQMANSNKIIFNVENIASGLYFIEINYNEGKYKLPVVIQH